VDYVEAIDHLLGFVGKRIDVAVELSESRVVVMERRDELE
jgi:hypothetical protein